METRYRVKFWMDGSGEKPVAKWLKGLPDKDKEYLGGLLRDLAFGGPFSRPKIFKHLEESLWEIRDLRSPGPGYRIYFAFVENVIILVVSSGNKSSQQRDIKQAKLRLDKHKEA